MQQSREGADSFAPTCRPKADWWDAYVEAHEKPDTINWNEFKMAFHSHHVPQCVIKLKEFQDLKQGSMTVSKYVTRFTQLSRFASNDVDIDEKKQECFLNGLDDGLAYASEARYFENFQTTIDKAFVLENMRGILSKCKQERHSQQSTNSSPASMAILHLLKLSSAPSLRVLI
jgi:hypothetical protein